MPNVQPVRLRSGSFCFFMRVESRGVEDISELTGSKADKPFINMKMNDNANSVILFILSFI